MKNKLSNTQLKKEMTTKLKTVALMTKAAMIRDMDSGVTFDEDSEKDIDMAEIEEEDWFDYIRRSTADAIDKMEHAKDSMLEQNAQENEMEISIENCDITE